MLQNLSKQVRDCMRRAEECAHIRFGSTRIRQLNREFPAGFMLGSIH